MTEEDAQAITELAEAEGIKPSEFIRRELRDSIQFRRAGCSREGVFILSHILAFYETIFNISTAHLRGIDVTAENADQIKSDFDARKDRLAELAIARAQHDD